MNQLVRAALPALALLAALSAPALAAPELITNGNFENWTVNGAATTQSYILSGGQTSGTSGATLTGWGNTGYSFVFSPGTASAGGATINSTSSLALWGPDQPGSANYSANGLGVSPTRGAFIASDGDYQQGYIYQTVTGLTIGQTYNLSFYWAAAQQSGYTGNTTEGWNVYWAESAQVVKQTFSTPTAMTASKGFTPWVQQAYAVTATQTSMLLAFLATGGPNGSPPFSLLDGVSLTSAPEPGTMVLMLAGLVGIAAVSVARRRA